ncbi:TetR/AcrR family transcriptional regulator [Pokkaliibacter sp. MBI-7]|uniref:TetR/AcrR family transcriptional regulator n=1 Tax=Pokkaliibacter sp. MBI-7 TaxID=3040600 RepID=UPI00244B2334|nr:TetR/AcrR family transcriptional regulator [Pokkaliibacter sp. MBI-7]MDH2432467.1 TetR/AcrR family transcriptional regulator [Pokkaliibacter sp. MBI-7]
MEAAASLFVEKGFDETSIDEIVLLAGSAKGTFYHHYESKQALLIALRQRVAEQYQTDMDAVLAGNQSDDLLERLETWVGAAFDAYINIGPLYEVVYGNYPASRWTSADMPFMTDFVALLREGHQRGIWIVQEPHLTATFIYRGILGAIDDLILEGKPIAGVKQSMVAVVRHAVGLQSACG